MQEASKNVQRYYPLKCLVGDLLSNVFVSKKFRLKCLFRGVGWGKVAAGRF